MQIKITKEVSQSILEKIEDLKLTKYYNFDETEFAENSLKNLDELKKVLEEPKMLRYDVDLDNFVYTENGEDKVITDVAGLNSFDQTDIEISNQLLDIGTIFQNDAVGDISKEMECFYITINIAGVFQGAFKRKFLRTLEGYNFEEWIGSRNVVGEVQNFDQLYKDFQKISTMKMRMLSSACSFKLREKKEAPLSFQTRGLPEDVVFALESCQNKVKLIRLKFDNEHLTAEKRKAMKKWEILQREDELNSLVGTTIEKELGKNNLLELWKIFKINAEYIPEEVSQEILDAAQETLDELTTENSTYFGEKERNSIEFLKKFRSSIEKKLKNAYILKLKEEQLKLWSEDRLNYKCPNKK